MQFNEFKCRLIITKLHLRCDPPVYQYLLFVLIFEQN
jgi:hypothetical protein